MQLVRIANAKGAAQGSELRRRENAARWAHLRPRNAQLYVENRCHLSCDHCYESEESHPPAARLSFEEWVRVLDELAALGVLYLTFTGGEIFLRKDLLDLVAQARIRRFAVTLYTSGTLIDDKKADQIAALRVSNVHVSVYSHDPQVHDRFTGVAGSHEKSLRALRLLAERGVPIVLKANLTTFNADCIDDLIALATSLGADWQLDPTVKPRMDGDRRPLQYALQPDEVRRLVLSRADLVGAFRRFRPDELCTGERSILDEDAVMCGAARTTISISADGQVHACGFFPIGAGSLRERSLVEIWRGSEQLDEIRRTTLGSMTACQSCDVRSTCSPCMAYALVEHGDHRQCASPSRLLATATRLLAERRVRAEEKMARGRPLPIVGDLDAPPPPDKAGVAALSTE